MQLRFQGIFAFGLIYLDNVIKVQILKTDQQEYWLHRTVMTEQRNQEKVENELSWEVRNCLGKSRRFSELQLTWGKEWNRRSLSESLLWNSMTPCLFLWQCPNNTKIIKPQVCFFSGACSLRHYYLWMVACKSYNMLWTLADYVCLREMPRSANGITTNKPKHRQLQVTILQGLLVGKFEYRF